jgi:hypothetical protein
VQKHQHGTGTLSVSGMTVDDLRDAISIERIEATCRLLQHPISFNDPGAAAA